MTRRQFDREPYTPPRLEVLGSFAELTKSGNGNGTETSTAPNKKNPPPPSG